MKPACALALVLAFAALALPPPAMRRPANAGWAYEIANELMSPFCPGRSLADCPCPTPRAYASGSPARRPPAARAPRSKRSSSRTTERSARGRRPRASAASPIWSRSASSSAAAGSSPGSCGARRGAAAAAAGRPRGLDPEVERALDEVLGQRRRRRAIAVKVYTRRGDGGDTDLFGGGRVPKSALRVEAYGAVDELNAALGVAAAATAERDLRELLQEMQMLLFALGGVLATPDAAHRAKSGLPEPTQADIERLEPASTRSRQSCAARALRAARRISGGRGAPRRAHGVPPCRAPLRPARAQRGRGRRAWRS